MPQNAKRLPTPISSAPQVDDAQKKAAVAAILREQEFQRQARALAIGRLQERFVHAESNESYLEDLCEIWSAAESFYSPTDSVIRIIGQNGRFGDGMAKYISEAYQAVVGQFDQIRMRLNQAYKVIEGGEGFPNLHSCLIHVASETKKSYDALNPIFEEYIENREKQDFEGLSVKQKLTLLSDYADRYDEEAVLQLVVQLFPSLTHIGAGSSQTSPSESPSLPTEAPEIYQGLRGPETPPAFVQRVYGPWLGHGLTRAHIRTLDSKLYDAINNWTSRPGNEWPSDVDLPTKAEQNTRDIAALETQAAAGNAKEILGKFTGKEAARLGAAISRRTKQ